MDREDSTELLLPIILGRLSDNGRMVECCGGNVRQFCILPRIYTQHCVEFRE